MDRSDERGRPRKITNRSITCFTHYLEEFRNAIRNKTALINEQHFLGRVEESFRGRLEMCAHENHHHLGNVIFFYK